ncbi:MAG: spore germination protein [Paenibacillaceae bacterium]|nr:spore germination protein [Paenibacillaceae bacterium]
MNISKLFPSWRGSRHTPQAREALAETEGRTEQPDEAAPFADAGAGPDSSGWDEASFRGLFRLCQDVNIKPFRFGDESDKQEVLLVYCEGLTDSKKMIDQVVLPGLQTLFDKCGFRSVEDIEAARTMQMAELRVDPDEESIETRIADRVFDGGLLLYFLPLRALFVLNISNRPERSPEEANTEVSIRGPKDGFVEDLSVNTALIRKRMRTPSLAYEQFVVGERTRTKVGLLYVYDIARDDVIREARERLRNIRIDGIVSTTQLEEIIADSSYSLLPLLGYTGRPDFAVQCLLSGRFIILVDGNPSATIAPANLLLLKSPEDVHFTFLSSSFGQVLRVFGLLLSLLLPGFWVALVAFHQDQLPFQLLATITLSRIGLPLSSPLEMFLVIAMLEIFREAGVRLPSAIGNTLTVVGGLIIGDAAIRAGLISPSLVVVTALTAVAGSTLVSQALSGIVSVLRIVIFLVSSALGLYGFLLCTMGLTLYLSTLRSFGVPYLAPLSPPSFADMARTLLRLPWSMRRRRPDMLRLKDKTKMGRKHP